MTKLFATGDARYRIERLTKTLRIAREILALSESQTNLLIRDLTDSRGELTINWSAAPTSRQCDAFAAAWELVGEDGKSVKNICAEVGRLEWEV